MNQSDSPLLVTLRIPGNWEHPMELVEGLPDGFRVTAEALFLPDGTEVELNLIPPDDEFPRVFKTSCRQPPTADELAIVESYKVMVALTGPGGTMSDAVRMMRAAAAIVQAGGAGVFIDNSAMAHGGGNWIQMADDGDADAVSFAFASIIRGQREVWTMGMGVMGFPDIVIRMADMDPDGETIVEVIRYVCGEERPIGDGHLLADEDGPIFQARTTDNDEFDVDSSMHNPFGRLKLVSMKDIAENN